MISDYLPERLSRGGEPTARQQRVVRIVIQALILIMVFIVPEVLMTTSHRHDVGSWRMYVKAAMLVGVFLLNYYWLIDRCLARPRGFVKLCYCNIAVVIIFMAVIQLMFYPLHPRPHFDGHGPEVVRPWLNILSVSLRDVVTVLMAIALSVAMKLSNYWLTMHQQKQESESRRQREELESLKRQLNPHFLFNTLNSIYALIAVSPSKAQNAVHVLSRMLRYVLYENAPTVALDDELNFVGNYVELMRLRIGQSMPINLKLSNSSGEQRIAPLIFISPVENAFKHGNTGMADAFIDIEIVCADGVVRAHFANRYVKTPTTPPADGGHGIGDANLRRRLSLIYGDHATISTTLVDGNVYNVDMTIDLAAASKQIQ